MEKQGNTGASDNEVDASSSEKQGDNSDIQVNISNTEKQVDTLKTLGFCQNTMLGGTRGSSACTGVCLMMLQNFWKTSDQTLNIVNIVSIYKQVMRKAVVTWNEEMLQEMDVVNANEYLEMRQSMMWKFYKGTHLCYPQLIHNNHYNCTRHNIFYIQHTVKIC